MGQVEFVAAADGDRGAEHTTGVLQHEVDHLGGDLLGSTDQVAFVLTVLVVDDNDELTGLEVYQCLFNCIDLNLFHI